MVASEEENKPSLSLKRGAFWVFVENVSKPIEPILLLLCAKYYAGGPWGYFKFYESLTFLFLHVGTLGLQKGVLWWQHQVDHKEYIKTIIPFVNSILLWSVCVAVAVGFFQYYWGVGESINSELHISVTTLILFVANIPFMVLSEVFYRANINMGNLYYATLGRTILTPIITYGGGLLSLFLLDGKWSLFECYLIGNIISFVLALGSFLYLHQIKITDWSFKIYIPKKMLSFSLPIGSSNIFSAISLRVDIVMIAGFSGLTSIEIYNIVTMIGKSLSGIYASFESLLFSVFSKQGKKGIDKKAMLYFNYAVWGVMTILGFVLGLEVLFGEYLLKQIHSQYASGYIPLIVYSTFLYIGMYLQLSGSMLQAIGKSIYTPIVSVTFFFVNLGLNWILIPKLDVLGAIMAYGVATCVSGIIYVVALRYYCDAKLSITLGLRKQWLIVAFVLATLSMQVLDISIYWAWMFGAIGMSLISYISYRVFKSYNKQLYVYSQN